MQEKNMRFGEFIKKKRLQDERDLTLKDLATVLGVSLSMLSDIEQCRRKPFDSDKIEQFCSYLNLSDEDKALRCWILPYSKCSRGWMWALRGLR